MGRDIIFSKILSVYGHSGFLLILACKAYEAALRVTFSAVRTHMVNTFNEREARRPDRGGSVRLPVRE